GPDPLTPGPGTVEFRLTDREPVGVALVAERFLDARGRRVAPPTTCWTPCTLHVVPGPHFLFATDRELEVDVPEGGASGSIRSLLARRSRADTTRGIGATFAILGASLLGTTLVIGLVDDKLLGNDSRDPIYAGFGVGSAGLFA